VTVLSSRITCLEDQANACGMVPDVGFICLLTRCRSGWTRMIATGGGYIRANSWSWSSLMIGHAWRLTAVVSCWTWREPLCMASAGHLQLTSRQLTRLPSVFAVSTQSAAFLAGGQ
jgi:hypothetical protein